MRKCWYSSFLSLAFGILSLHMEAADPVPTSNSPSAYHVFVGVNPLPATLTLGGVWKEHKLGLFGSRVVSNNAGYKSWGLEYAFHLAGATRTGWYGKGFWEHRIYERDFVVGTYSEETRTGMHDTHNTLNHHRANLLGMMVGYQRVFATRLYWHAAFGVQYNTNPVNIGPIFYGIGDSTKHRSSATGELGLGFFL